MADALEDDNRFLIDNVEIEFLRWLLIRNVRYVLIGGHAVYYYGYRRNVGDLDIIIEYSSENMARFLSVLQDINMKLDNSAFENLCKPNTKFHIPFYEVDVLTSVEHFSFIELFENRRIVELYGVEISMISNDYLLRMKKGSDRTKDKRDFLKLMVSEQGC